MFSYNWCSSSYSNLIQNDGTGLHGHQWNCTCLPPSAGQTSQGSLTQDQLARWYHHHWEQTKLTQTPLCSSLLSVVEQTPDQCKGLQSHSPTCMTNVLISSNFGQKRLLNALNVNVNPRWSCKIMWSHDLTDPAALHSNLRIAFNRQYNYSYDMHCN